jgi:hypothetical protein
MFPFNHGRDHQGEMARFLNDLRDLVLTETAAQRRQIHTQWEKPLASRVADGFGIENVSLVRLHPNDQVELTLSLVLLILIASIPYNRFGTWHGYHWGQVNEVEDSY